MARPNMVLVLLDQLRADVVGAYGSPICRTPSIDALAADGLAFDRAYTPIGICSAARASLFTGKYPHRHGILNNIHGPDAIREDLRPEEVTFPALLAEAGYRTLLTGKWHVGVNTGPEDIGFTDVGPGDRDLLPRLVERRRGLGLDPDGPLFNVEVSTQYPPLSSRARRGPVDFFPVMGREPYPLEGTPQGLYLDSCLELLESVSQAGDPFFCMLSFIGPHWPHVLPEPWWSMYDPAGIPPWPNFEDDFDGKPGANRSGPRHYGVETWGWREWAPVVASYFGSVTMHDALVGRLAAALDRLGRRDDTLLVVTADHGDMTGSHRQFNKGPWMYEEVYRIPMVVRWPDRIAPGTRRGEYVSSLDLMSTFLEAAGVTPPDGAAPDSRSLVPLLTGRDVADWREEFVAEFHGDEFGLYSQRMVHAGRYKLIFNPHSIDELYDLQADPHELVNLAGEPEYAKLRDDLESRLAAWMVDTADPLWLLAHNYMA